MTRHDELTQKIAWWEADIAKREAEVARLRATKGTRKRAIEYAEGMVASSRRMLEACQESLQAEVGIS